MAREDCLHRKTCGSASFCDFMDAAKAACTELLESGVNLLIKGHNRSAIILGAVVGVAVELRDTETPIVRITDEGIPHGLMSRCKVTVIGEAEAKHESVHKRHCDIGPLRE